jgi:hypothetical protein
VTTLKIKQDLFSTGWMVWDYGADWPQLLAVVPNRIIAERIKELLDRHGLLEVPNFMDCGE